MIEKSELLSIEQQTYIRQRLSFVLCLYACHTLKFLTQKKKLLMFVFKCSIDEIMFMMKSNVYKKRKEENLN